MIAAHGLIQTRIDAIQLSKACAKLSAPTNTTRTADATRPATTVTFQRAARTPIERAASEQEYRLRMFVAIGPCTSNSSTGTAITPNVLTTSAEGSLPPPALARQAPSVASHTVGMYMPSAEDQNTAREDTLTRTKRL